MASPSISPGIVLDLVVVLGFWIRGGQETQTQFSFPDSQIGDFGKPENCLPRMGIAPDRSIEAQMAAQSEPHFQVVIASTATEVALPMRLLRATVVEYQRRWDALHEAEIEEPRLPSSFSRWKSEREICFKFSQI